MLYFIELNHSSFRFIGKELSVNKLKKLLPLLLSLLLSTAVFNLRINKQQVIQPPACYRDFERGQRKQKHVVIRKVVITILTFFSLPFYAF